MLEQEVIEQIQINNQFPIRTGAKPARLCTGRQLARGVRLQGHRFPARAPGPVSRRSVRGKKKLLCGYGDGFELDGSSPDAAAYTSTVNTPPARVLKNRGVSRV